MGCSRGTYIRTLCADIGRRLSCGAHLTALQRVRSGAFHISGALARGRAGGRRHGVRDIIPLNAALTGMPELVVAQALIEKIRQGVQIRARDMEGSALRQLGAGTNGKNRVA